MLSAICLDEPRPYDVRLDLSGARVRPPRPTCHRRSAEERLPSKETSAPRGAARERSGAARGGARARGPVAPFRNRARVMSEHLVTPLRKGRHDQRRTVAHRLYLCGRRGGVEIEAGASAPTWPRSYPQRLRRDCMMTANRAAPPTRRERHRVVPADKAGFEKVLRSRPDTRARYARPLRPPDRLTDRRILRRPAARRAPRDILARIELHRAGCQGGDARRMR